MPQRLRAIKPLEVSLVGAPANLRKFALMKNLLGEVGKLPLFQLRKEDPMKRACMAKARKAYQMMKVGGVPTDSAVMMGCKALAMGKTTKAYKGLMKKGAYSKNMMSSMLKAYGMLKAEEGEDAGNLLDMLEAILPPRMVMEHEAREGWHGQKARSEYEVEVEDDPFDNELLDEDVDFQEEADAERRGEAMQNKRMIKDDDDYGDEDEFGPMDELDDDLEARAEQLEDEACEHLQEARRLEDQEEANEMRRDYKLGGREKAQRPGYWDSSKPRRQDSTTWDSGKRENVPNGLDTDLDEDNDKPVNWDGSEKNVAYPQRMLGPINNNARPMGQQKFQARQEDLRTGKGSYRDGMKGTLKATEQEDSMMKLHKAVANLPLASRELSWDATAAEKRIEKWATGADGNIDWDKYGKAFAYQDPVKKDQKGGYKLPFADVVGGELKAVPRAISAVAAALGGARGGVGIPEAAKAEIRKGLSRYYDRLDMDAPWSRDEVQKGGTQTVNEILKGLNLKELPEGVSAAIQTLYKAQEEAITKAERLEEIVKSERDRRLTEEAVAFAKGLNFGEVDEMAMVVKTARQMMPMEVVSVLEKHLTQASEIIKSSQAFREVGSVGMGLAGSSWAKIEQMAQGIVQKDSTGMTKEQAISLVMEKNPALYQAYLDEQASARR